MANGNGYGASTKPSAQFFSKEQRQRLEAVTYARDLLGTGRPHFEWLELADYITTGRKS